MDVPENNDPDVKRVLVGIPLKGHTPPESYHDRIMLAYHMGGVEILQRENKEKPRYEFIWISMGEIFIPFAREMLAEQAVKYKCDYLFMIDDDMMAMSDLFYRLVKHDVDIVAPLAFSRNPPHKPVIFSSLEGYDPVARKPYFVNNVVFNYPKNKLVECDAVGFGAVLIKTEMLYKMPRPWFMGSQGTGEDILFCLNAKKFGYRVFMDTATKLGHLSHPTIVTEDYVENISKMSEEEREKFYGRYQKYASMDPVK